MNERDNRRLQTLSDEYDLYYGEDAVPEEEIIVKTPGPLSRRPSVTSAFPFLVFFAIAALCTSLHQNVYPELLWVSGRSIFPDHQYWRLITALFAHSGPVHLLSNTPLLLFFSLFLYDYFGIALFPVLSLVSGILANLVTVSIYPDYMKLLGASGMAYSMVALWLVLYIRHDSDHSVPVRIFRAIGFSLVMIFPTTYEPQTSYLAHTAGFVIGIIIGVISLPFVKVRIQ